MTSKFESQKVSESKPGRDARAAAGMDGPAPSKHDTSSALTAHRRRQVSAMRIRGYTLDEIVQTLESLGIVDEKTGLAFARSTIYKDLQFIAAEWIKDSRKSNAEHRSRILAQVQELRRRLWQEMANKPSSSAKNLLESLKFEAQLFGLNQPFKVQFTDETGSSRRLQVDEIAEDMSIEEMRLYKIHRRKFREASLSETPVKTVDAIPVEKPVDRAE